MTLFDTESQYREKATIWRMLSELPLYASLAEGRMWRWFAVNMPMDLVPTGAFTGDIDLLARLNDYPRSRREIYKAWEVKVSLLTKEGRVRSLKARKTERTMNQLRAYRRFGSPDVSLLDVFLCESGFFHVSGAGFDRKQYPPSLDRSLTTKIRVLGEEGFGYKIMPFGHGKDGDVDVGLLAVGAGGLPGRVGLTMLDPVESEIRDPFSSWVQRIEKFAVESGDRRSRHTQMVFCRDCRQLHWICMRDEDSCPGCGGDLIAQS